IFDDAFSGFPATTQRLNLAEPGSTVQYSDLNNADMKNAINMLNGTGIVRSFPLILNTLSGITNPEPLLLGMTGLYESDNGGSNVGDVSPTDIRHNVTSNVTSIAYGSRNSGLAAYFTTDTGEIWVRNDSGKNFAWVPPPSWDSGAYALKIVMDPD